MKKILIFTSTAIGNTILVFPLIQSLKNKYKNSEIIIYCENKKLIDMLLLEKKIDSCVEKIDDLKNMEIDIAIFTWCSGKTVKNKKIRDIIYNSKKTYIQYNRKTLKIQLFNCIFKYWLKKRNVKYSFFNHFKHEILNNLDIIDFKEKNLEVTKKYFELQEIVENEYKNSIVITVESAYEESPKIFNDTFLKKLINHYSKNEKVVLLGIKRKVDNYNRNKNVINLIGKTTLSETAQIINSAKFIVTFDTGLAHLAAALGKITKVYWGPSNFIRTRPVGEKTVIYNKNLICSPCMNVPTMCFETEAKEKCPYNLECMNFKEIL